MAEDTGRDPELKWLGWRGRFKYREWISDCRTTNDITQLILDLHAKHYKKDLYNYFRIALDLGADPNRRKDGQTLTGYAASNDEWHGQKSIVMLLLERGGNPDEALREVVVSYCGEGAFETARAILEFGGDPNAPDREGNNAVILASGNGWGSKSLADRYTQMLRLLLEHGGDPNFVGKGRGSNTPLGRAAGCGDGSLELFRLLLEKGADPALANDDGDTPLMLAASSRAVQITKLLLEKGVDPNHQDSNGFTALMEAAQQAGEDDDDELEAALNVMRILIENGAEVDMKDSGERTAYDHAKRWRNGKAMSLLEKMGLR